jgi:hypothetical protein
MMTDIVPQSPRTADFEYSPHRIDFGAISNSQTRDASLTVGKAPSSEGVTAHITEDSSGGLFKIKSLEVYEIERQGPHGLPTGMTLIDRSDGSAPVSVNKDNMVKVRLTFTAPVSTSTYSFSAYLTLGGHRWFVPRVPMHAGIGLVKTILLRESLDIEQNGEGDIPIRVSCLEGPDTDVQYIFSVDPTTIGISMDPVSVFVPQGGSKDLNLHFKVSYQASLGLHYLIVQEFASNGQSDVIYPTPKVNVTPYGGRARAANIEWKLANPMAIQIDEKSDVWHAGCVLDALAVGTGVVASTEKGGVWIISDNGFATPVSNDWNHPDIKCLEFGPDGPSHIYAGCSSDSEGALYETDTSSSFPLLNWREVPIPRQIRTFRIAVLKDIGKIVLAADNGIWWSEIPSHIASGGAYNFKQVNGKLKNSSEYFPIGGYSGIAVGPNNSVVVSAWGSDINTGLYGLFRGNWVNNDLVFERISIDLDEIKDTDMIWTSLASYENPSDEARNRRIMYLLASYNYKKIENGIEKWHTGVKSVLRSDDGGINWRSCGRTIEDAPRHDPPHTIDEDGLLGDEDSGRLLHGITVSSFDPNIVAFCWKYPLLSTNGGNSWRALGRKWDGEGWDYDNHHQHDDVYRVCFDRKNNQKIYVISDGGIVLSWDLGKTFSSGINRNLTNLQFLAPYAYREFWGTVSGSETIPGLIGGGLMDNGNVYSVVGVPDWTPWKKIQGGDGGLMLFMTTLAARNLSGSILHWNNGEDVKNAKWNAATMQLEDIAKIRVSTPPPASLSQPVVEGVVQPIKKKDSEYMFAVAGVGTDLYGLFGKGDNIHWNFLGKLNLVGNQYITAVGSSDGNIVTAGTIGARIFNFNTNTSTAVEATVPALTLNVNQAAIARIIMLNEKRGFAIYNVTPRGSVSNSFGNGWILRTEDGQNWNSIGAGYLPNEIFYGIDTDGDRTLFVSTDNRVFASFDNGDRWYEASSGLPRRSHCADLRYVFTNDGQGNIYLSTFGRSVWRARLSP